MTLDSAASQRVVRGLVAASVANLRGPLCNFLETAETESALMEVAPRGLEARE